MNKGLRKRTKGYAFWCPGCKVFHGIENWAFDGNEEVPTFSPSVLVRGRDFTELGEQQYQAWCQAGYPMPHEPFESADQICHSYIRAGMIEYLDDCTHKFRGKTIPLAQDDIP
jgi:hypothetical protein